jgi:hypothetical protein
MSQMCDILVCSHSRPAGSLWKVSFPHPSTICFSGLGEFSLLSLTLSFLSSVLQRTDPSTICFSGLVHCNSSNSFAAVSVILLIASISSLTPPSSVPNPRSLE